VLKPHEQRLKRDGAKRKTRACPDRSSPINRDAIAILLREESPMDRVRCAGDSASKKLLPIFPPSLVFSLDTDAT